jgi:leader peptidase (prepilin peptidase)/N-methyltransferase
MAATLLAASLALLLVGVTVTDLRTRLIPNRMLAAASLVALAIVAASDPASLPERFASAFGAGAFLGAAHAARPEGMGLGDVKLAAVVGLYLGSAVAIALLVALSAGALAGLVLLARHGASARSRAIPFAPFIATGAAVACLPLSTVGGWS